MTVGQEISIVPTKLDLFNSTRPLSILAARSVILAHCFSFVYSGPSFSEALQVLSMQSNARIDASWENAICGAGVTRYLLCTQIFTPQRRHIRHPAGEYIQATQKDGRHNWNRKLFEELLNPSRGAILTMQLTVVLGVPEHVTACIRLPEFVCDSWPAG